MNQEITSKIENLKNCLYQNSYERSELDKVSIKKNLFELLRECIKERQYNVEVGSFILDINPSNLSVKYETDETTVELSNEDVYYETTRELEVRYFALEDKEVYSIEEPTIEVTGLVTNIEGLVEESYQIELFTYNENDNIKNYINNIDSFGFKYTDIEIENQFSVIITRSIKVEQPRLDVIDLFKPGKVIPIKYNHHNNNYEKEPALRRNYLPNNYSLYLPSLSDKKDVVTYIYSSIIEFYTAYINNQ